MLKYAPQRRGVFVRYLVIKKENSSPEVIIWTKSQHRIPVKHRETRECSHRDYLRNNNIPFEKVLSVGDVRYNLQTGETKVMALPWDHPEKNDDICLIQKATISFYKASPELAAEIQTDWNEYQAWLKCREELLGRK